jgi:hypothetical protein
MKALRTFDFFIKEYKKTEKKIKKVTTGRKV